MRVNRKDGGLVRLPARGQRKASAFSLVEAVVALLVVGILAVGVISLYVQSAIRAEWSAYWLAGEMMAIRGMEQTRSAKWDPRAPAPVDELVASNFPPVVDTLDVGPGGVAVTYATNVTSIQTVSAAPRLKAIRVDCTWVFPRRGIFTNTIFTYRGPDQ